MIYPGVTLTHPALAGWVPPSPALRERGYYVLNSELLSRTAGEGGPSPKGLVGEGSVGILR